MTYDPAFMNTASCRSAITYIDGDRGILRYRGYPIEQLAEKSTYPRGRLSDRSWRAADRGAARRTGCTKSRTTRFVHENIKKFIDGFHHDAHPMGMFVSTVAALSTFYPEAKNIHDEESRQQADVSA